ncbi:hypothetical protein HD554DRAFT_1642935 [Boletus coccyginus]|nr:hypothetical protein HD554DRAFT_1642935 [Boletus coccyginus]
MPRMKPIWILTTQMQNSQTRLPILHGHPAPRLVKAKLRPNWSRFIGTTAATEQFNPARQASLVATTSDEVAPSQSTIPRSIATSTVPPASESDDDFFFTHLIAREPVNAATTGSKRPRHVSLSELASESHPSGPGPSGKRIKSENYRTSGLNLKDSEDEAFDDSQVAKAGPSGSRTQIGRRSTTVRIPGGPSRNPWE